MVYGEEPEWSSEVNFPLFLILSFINFMTSFFKLN